MKKKPENKPKAGKGTPKQAKGRRVPTGAPPPPEETRWKPGQSGNPGGRPKLVKEFREACQDKWEEVLSTWLEILQNPVLDPHARNRAGELIANYAFGKPAQAVQIEDPEGTVLTLVDIVKRAVGSDGPRQP